MDVEMTETLLKFGAGTSRQEAELGLSIRSEMVLGSVREKNCYKPLVYPGF